MGKTILGILVVGLTLEKIWRESMCIFVFFLSAHCFRFW